MLKEPEKALLAPYLDAERMGERFPKIERRAFVTYYIRNTVSLITENCLMRSRKLSFDNSIIGQAS